MLYYYDLFGNLTTTVDPNRATEIEPPTCPTGEQPNWMGDGWACIVYTAPAAPAAQSLGTIITSRAFFKRLGVANTTWLYAQAPTNPTLEMYKDQVWDGPVDLDNPDTAADLAYLTTLAGSPVTADVVNTILTAPVQANEVPG